MTSLLPPSTRLLVCGDRNWAGLDRQYMYAVLDGFHKHIGVGVVIEGEARGADRMAREWAESRGIPVERYPAKWDEHGKAAGPIRNRVMLQEGKPETVIAFHRDLASSKGTRDMVAIAARAHLTVYVVPFEGRRPFWSPLP